MTQTKTVSFLELRYLRTYAVIAYLLTPSPSATLLPLPEGEGWGEGAKRACFDFAQHKHFGEMRKSWSTQALFSGINAPLRLTWFFKCKLCAILYKGLVSLVLLLNGQISYLCCYGASCGLLWRNDCLWCVLLKKPSQKHNIKWHISCLVRPKIEALEDVLTWKSKN